MKGVQPSSGDPPFDRATIEPKSQQLSSRDDAELRRGQLREALVEVWGCFYTHTVY